jgi:hypothetical protein
MCSCETGARRQFLAPKVRKSSSRPLQTITGLRSSTRGTRVSVKAVSRLSGVTALRGNRWEMSPRRSCARQAPTTRQSQGQRPVHCCILQDLSWKYIGPNVALRSGRESSLLRSRPKDARARSCRRHGSALRCTSPGQAPCEPAKACPLHENREYDDTVRDREDRVALGAQRQGQRQRD